MASILAPEVQASYHPTEKAPTYMIMSPYVDEPHLLDLRTVNVQEQLLAHALVKLQSLRDDYATANYVETFNWDEVAADLRERAVAIGHEWTAQTFYIVVFRYWFGTPDDEGRNLTTCVWTTREDAIKGGVGPAHRRAAGAARHNYTEWRIERLALVFGDAVQNWRIEEWADR